MVDGSQTIAWVDRRVGALTEARIEARQAIMRNTVEEALERLKAEQHNFAMMRALLNIRPPDNFSKNVRPASVSVLKEWKSRRWPTPKLAA